MVLTAAAETFSVGVSVKASDSAAGKASSNPTPQYPFLKIAREVCSVAVNEALHTISKWYHLPIWRITQKKVKELITPPPSPHPPSSLPPHSCRDLLSVGVRVGFCWQMGIQLFDLTLKRWLHRSDAERPAVCWIPGPAWGHGGGPSAGGTALRCVCVVNEWVYLY